MNNDMKAAQERFGIRLPSGATMRNIAESLWNLPRNLVSDGYDAALGALSEQVDMTIHRYPTGQECLTWTIPPKWSCDEARLETLDGETIFSSGDNPLHAFVYSIPFEGEVSHAELLEHLHVSPRMADAVPFAFSYYLPDWGLCCSQNQREALDRDRYRVVIRSRTEPGELKVGEAVAKGRSEESVILCAHLCHPHMFNDDMAGVALGLDIIRHLQARDDLHYTYRLLILPETVGSAAWISDHEELIPRLRTGLFLEMLATGLPHAVQLSHPGDTRFDMLCTMLAIEDDSTAWAGPFGTIALNDERMFNAPGVRVPMVSLCRAHHPDHPDRPYPEYHSDQDNPANAHFDQLEDSRDLVLAFIDSLENDLPVRPLFKGEIFCSRYPSIEYVRMHKLLMHVTYLLDGRRTALDIAHQTGLPLAEVRGFLDVLAGEGLVEYGGERPRPDEQMPPAKYR